MKRCPECRRDYYDDTLIYCLDDGNTLLEGPGTMSEPATAILSVPPAVAGGSMRDTGESELKTAILQPPATAGGTDPAVKKSLFAHRAAKPVAAMVVIVLVAVGGFFGYRYFAPANSKQIESIAVMPFINDSGNADIEYLTDGMTETIIGNLSQLSKLSVKARSSVFRYKGKDTDPKTIGKELNVQAILTGRVVERGDQFTVSLSLIEAATENVIWSQQYTRKQTELVTLPGEVAREGAGVSIAELLAIRSVSGPGVAVASHAQIDLSGCHTGGDESVECTGCPRQPTDRAGLRPGSLMLVVGHQNDP